MTASGDRQLLSYGEESTYGQVPAGPPTLQDIRYTTESLVQTHNSVRSSQIDPGRMIPDLKRVGLAVGGSVGYELSFGSHEDLMAAAIGSAGFSTPPSANTGTFSTNHTTRKFTGTGIHTNVAVGDWITVDGFSTQLDGGVYKVIAVATGEITVAQAIGTSSVAGGGNEEVQVLSQIKNGTALRTFFFEKHYQDLTNEFRLLRGCGLNTWSMNSETEQLITGEFGVIGKSAESASSTSGDGSNTPVTETDIMAAVDEIDNVFFGPRTGGGFANTSTVAFGFQTNANIRARTALGTLGATSLGLGKFEVTGTFRLYFASQTEADYFLEFTDGLGIAFSVKDFAGNRYIFEFPRIKFSAMPDGVGGENQDIMLDFSWTAIKQADEDTMMRVCKLAA